MKSQQARQRTQQRRRCVELAHQHCPIEYRASGPHWGMYCQTHGTWIQWISQRDLEKLR